MEEKGFQKLEVVQEDTVTSHAMNASASSRKRRSRFSIKNKKALGIIIALVIILGLGSIYTGIQALAVYKQAMVVKVQARKAYDAIKQQNIILTKDEMVKTKAEIAVLDKKVGGLGYLQIIPFIGSYYQDGKRIVDAASHGVEAAIISTDALIPYADVLGLKGASTFAGGSAQERIRLAVKTMGKVVPQIDKIEEQLIIAQKDIDGINPKRYPEIGKIKTLRAQIEQLRGVADGAVIAVQQGKPLIKALPTILGESKEKKYLVLFQNDAELRPTGGFLTYYAIFRIEEGIIKVDESSDIYDLDSHVRSHPKASEIVAKYLPKVNQSFIRDSNISPDFVTSMNLFNDQYSTASNKKEVDGIIAIDTHFLVNAIRILGEVSASGLTFKADNDPRCDCPQVVYALEDQISKPVGYIKDNRKGLLADLMLATMNKALASSAKKYWGPLFQQFIADAQQKHILFYLYDKDAQSGMEALNWAGRVRNFDGDYLYVNDANFGGQKSNLFINEDAKIEYSVSGSGEVNKKVTITYKNPWKYSDCNLEHGQLCLNATLRNLQRFYVPKGSTLTSVKGSQVKVETKEEFGKTYYESFFTVDPLGKSTIVYEYKLPFKVEKGSKLPVLIQKQPGVEKIAVEIDVNGHKVEKFDLISDKELSLTVF